MFKCHICGKVGAQGRHNYEDRFTCLACEPMTDYYHVDDFEIINGEVKRTVALSGKTESEQRWVLINIIYTIFDNEINQKVFSLIPRYLKKGYTYLGMVRALEYHYFIRKSSKEKANNSIGIIPYVYDDAQKYFEKINSRHYLQYLSHANNIDKPAPVIEKKVVDQQKRPQIDMNAL